MATPTPPELARPRFQRVRRLVQYAYDPYYFAHTSVSHGTNQLPALIPATGPGAAGSTFPNLQPQVLNVEVIVEGTLTPEQTYGSNLGRPAGVAANVPGGI